MNNPALDAAIAAVVLVAAAALVNHAGGGGSPPGAPARVVVIGVEGLSWFSLSPALKQGTAPHLGRLAAGQRANLSGTAGQPLRFLWEWAVRVRPAVRADKGQDAVVGLQLWDVVARARKQSVVVSWPGLVGVRIVPERGPADVLPVVPDAPAAQLPDELRERVAMDRGAATVAARLAGRLNPDLLVVGLLGPRGANGTAPAFAPAEYWRLFDECVGKVAGALGPDATVVLVSRGAGSPGSPGGEGVWIAAGPRLARGPRPGPVRHLEIAPTLLALLGLPQPAGSMARPSPWVLDSPAGHVRWQELP